MNQRKAAFFDLDSTLANTLHRHEIISKDIETPTDWLSYSLACYDDVPFAGVAALARILKEAGYLIVVISSRHEQARALTMAWLSKYSIDVTDVVLRGENETQDHVEYKIMKVRQWLDRHPSVRGALMVDDWEELREPFEEALQFPLLLVNPAYISRNNSVAK